jgi:hypothetical protein
LHMADGKAISKELVTLSVYNTNSDNVGSRNLHNAPQVQFPLCLKDFF